MPHLNLRNDASEHPSVPDVAPAASPNFPLPTSVLDDIHDAASPPLVTQQPRALEGRDLERRVTVVTVTQTNTDPSGNTGDGNITGPPPTTVPTGIIVGSVVVGVILAVVMVGIWVWWGKRLQRKKRYGGVSWLRYFDKRLQSRF